MLFYLASWTLLLGLAAVIGNAVATLFQAPFSTIGGDEMIIAAWLGLLTMGSTLLVLSIALPLQPAIGLALLGALAGIAILVRPKHGVLRSLSSLEWSVVVSLGVLSVITALNSTRTVEAYDTGLYHYQFVRWLSQYGTVRGFALLQERFGVSSSWFALAAPFDFGPFQGRVAGLTGGLAIFICLCHFALSMWRVVTHRAMRADWFLIGGYGLIIPICLAWTFEVSLSPDLPAWILTLLTGWLMVAAAEPRPNSRPAENQHVAAILPLLIAFGALTVKLSSAAIVVIAGIFYWVHSNANWFTRLIDAAAAMLICVPVFFANIVSSGCPLYPNSLMCLDVPWGVGKAAAKQSAAQITSWARWGGPAPAGGTAWNWILPWFSHIDKLLLMVFCLLCLLIFLAKRGWRENQSFVYVLVLALTGTVFLFVTAPNPRFGAGYLALYPALVLASVGPELQRRWSWQSCKSKRGSSHSVAYVIVVIAILLALHGGIREARLEHSIHRVSTFQAIRHYSWRERLLIPPSLARSSGDIAFARNRHSDAPETLDLSSQRYHGIDYLLTEGGDQCWAAPIPCLPSRLTGNIQLRNSADGLRDGFTLSLDRH